jgi:hypothetical protein
VLGISPLDAVQSKPWQLSSFVYACCRTHAGEEVVLKVALVLVGGTVDRNKTGLQSVTIAG